MINPETSKLSDGISTEYGLITVDINRSMFDGKMAAFLFGAGRASCQMCLYRTNLYRWFNLLVYHLYIGKLSWCTKAQPIKESMKVVQALIQKQTGLKVDQPDSSGGTKSIGNVDRKAFSDNSEYLKCVISLITFPHRPALTKIHNQLAAILRVLNSSNKVNTLELGKLCQDTYLCILDSFL